MTAGVRRVLATVLVGLGLAPAPAAYAASRRAVRQPTATVAAASEPALIQTLSAARWRFDSARHALPPVQVVHQEALEKQDFIQYAFDAGAMRLYVNRGPQGGDIFAVLVDIRAPRYATFARLGSTTRYTTYHQGPYVIVLPLRPVSQEVFERLRAKQWTASELEQQLGAPSYRWHVHGLGYLGLTYVPQGLSFIGHPISPATYQIHAADVEDDWRQQNQFEGLPPVRSLSQLDYRGRQAETREACALELLSQRTELDRALANGKRSADGKFVAGLANIEGLGSSGELVIQETGKPERRYAGATFTHDKDFLWLNPHVVIFRTYSGATQEFYALDTVTGTRTRVAQAPVADRANPPRRYRARDFGISGPQRFWYTTADDEIREVTVESAKPSSR